MSILKRGSTVSWKWQGHSINGKIEEVFHEPIEKQIKGTIVKRNGSKENPAYYIKETDKEAYVLKLHSELN